MGVRNGQYFIIGTILIAGILMGILGITNSVTTTFTSDDITRSLFENSLDEFPQAVAGAAREEHTSENIEQEMRRYTDFQQYVALQYGINLQTHFAIGLPTEDGYNITFGNFRDETLENVWIRVDDTAYNIGSVNVTEIDTYRFPTQERTMDMTINATGFGETFTTSRKVLSFIDMEAQTGDTVWRETQID